MVPDDVPRLQLARQLASEQGVIFISIDDNELVNLRLLAQKFSGVRTLWPRSAGREGEDGKIASICCRA